MTRGSPAAVRSTGAHTMIDATPSANPMPAQPVATVTRTEALPPPPAPLPHAVAPAVTGSVSNLDFPPVDDAFALELRAETIEQLAGGDALRRGASERIEAGRSQTNADLVAGRDRVRVQGALHEHTGHGLAELAAHLHTTVDGVLDVHAASEDTVLLAGHMRELWDGGAAIVAAMTDDTVGGGGIRVTTPLDLWVHGLMGVEERIGTCTADAVLLELGATHYEREYGPGVHAAGLAGYTGSLYQSSRSTFQPLMRVSSGVRNLIAGGGRGDGGGDGGAGSAPGASPAPVPAETGAAATSVTGTLAAGRRAAQTPAAALDTADALTDARRVPLDELADSVDARAGEEMGEAGAVMRAEDLPELTRYADTAERLGALQVTLRMDATESASETAGGFRGSELEGAVSMHPATGGGGALEIEPPSAVHGENAPMIRPHPGVRWGQGSEMELGLLGGADRPPQWTTQASDLLSVDRRLRELRSHYTVRSGMDISKDFSRVILRITERVVRRFASFGGNTDELVNRPAGTTRAEHAFRVLQETARQADGDDDHVRAGAIRKALDTIDERAVEEFQALCARYGIAVVPSTQAMQRPPVTTGPSVTVAVIPPPAHVPVQFDWIATYRQVRGLAHHYSDIGRDVARIDFETVTRRLSQLVMHRFKKFGGNPDRLRSPFSGFGRAEQAYLAIVDMSRRASESDNAARAYVIRRALEDIYYSATKQCGELTTKYGALDALSIRASQPKTTEAMQTTRAMLLQPARVGPTTSVALPATVMPPVTDGAARVPVSAPDPGSVGHVVQVPGVPGLPPASSLPGHSLAEAAGARAGGLGRWRLDPPATASGATAAHPAATETIVTPSLGETSSFWLQPADPAPAPDTAPFDSGLHHAGETVQPPPVTTTPSGTAPAPGAPYHVPARVGDDFAGELATGRLPGQAIDLLIEGYRATDEGGRNTLYIEYLHTMKESIERARRDACPGGVDSEWLDPVRALELARRRGELGAPGAASATGLPELDPREIDRLLGTGEGVSHPAPLAPPLAPGHTGAGAVAPPPAADPWRIRPPGIGGEPRPVAFDPWSAPPDPSSHVVYTETTGTAVMSAAAPPGWQDAETPGFAWAASGVVELPFSRREAIVHRFRANDAMLEAEVTLRIGGADALGWSVTRWRAVLADLYRLHDAAQVHPAATAAMADVDWPAIETLVRILHVPTPSP